MTKESNASIDRPRFAAGTVIRSLAEGESWRARVKQDFGETMSLAEYSQDGGKIWKNYGDNYPIVQSINYRLSEGAGPTAEQMSHAWENAKIERRLIAGTKKDVVHPDGREEDADKSLAAFAFSFAHSDTSMRHGMPSPPEEEAAPDHFARASMLSDMNGALQTEVNLLKAENSDLRREVERLKRRKK